MVKVAFLMANYGHDPTETAVPYQEFKKAGYEVDFVTEMGNMPECDRKMFEGWTQKLLVSANSLNKPMRHKKLTRRH